MFYKVRVFVLGILFFTVMIKGRFIQATCKCEEGFTNVFLKLDGVILPSLYSFNNYLCDPNYPQINLVNLLTERSSSLGGGMYLGLGIRSTSEDCRDLSNNYNQNYVLFRSTKHTLSRGDLIAGASDPYLGSAVECSPYNLQLQSDRVQVTVPKYGATDITLILSVCDGNCFIASQQYTRGTWYKTSRINPPGDSGWSTNAEIPFGTITPGSTQQDFELTTGNLNSFCNAYYCN